MVVAGVEVAGAKVEMTVVLLGGLEAVAVRRSADRGVVAAFGLGAAAGAVPQAASAHIAGTRTTAASLADGRPDTRGGPIVSRDDGTHGSWEIALTAPKGSLEALELSVPLRAAPAA